ncbi:Elongator complex protein 5 [Trinorchestia longiramus]|nr:Elongator complex protein 5 [Trinorchestia longiramus]
MTTSALKSILQMKEVPFPSLLLITDEVNSASGTTLSQALIDKMTADGHYSIHCVHGSPFSEPWPNSNEVTHYYPSFAEYGEDPTAFDNFMSTYRNTHQNKFKNSMPHLSEVSSKTLMPSQNAADVSLENSEASVRNPDVNENSENVQKTLVLVDRLEDILLHTTARYVLLSCREVTEDGGIVVLVCSSSIILPAALQHLKYAASSVIELTSAEESSSHWQGIADVVIRRHTGKIIKSREFYHIDPKLGTISTAVAPPCSSHLFPAIPDVQLPNKETTSMNKSSFTKNPALENRAEILGGGKGAPKISLKSTGPVTDISSDAWRVAAVGDGSKEGNREDQAINALVSQATFSLQLSDEERRAKNNLLLPHQRVLQSGTGGIVHYTPDSEDWDEEDPDDDLDI